MNRFMRVSENNRREIEEKLKGLGDYVKIDYLESCLKRQLDFDTRKFVLTTLADLYKNRKMFLDAGKMMLAAANINTTFQGKVNDFLGAARLFIKAGDFNNTDLAFEKAISCANTSQKIEIKQIKKENYKEQAEIYLKNDKRKHAIEAYERLLSLDLEVNEKKEAQEKLLNLYEKLGKIRDYYSLKRVM